MAVLTAAQADRIDRLMPEAEAVQLGSSIKGSQDLQAYQPIIIEKAITSTAASAVVAFVAPYAMRIVDVIVRATATKTNGALQPLKAASGMCTAIACAADGAVTHMSTGAVAANLLLAAGDTVNLIATGDAAAEVVGVVTFVAVQV
jgi:hypothetical protein